MRGKMENTSLMTRRRSRRNLSNDELLSVYLLLDSRDMIFSKGDTDLGPFTAVKHHIDTGNSKPIKQRMRRTPLGYANEEQAYRKSSECCRDRPSCSKWASPSVLVRKRDGFVRWCIDIRKLNDVTVKDCYPLPLLQEYIYIYICTREMPVFHYPGYDIGLLSIRGCRER